MMRQDNIPHLLEKFYAGTTTPEEELILHLLLLDEPSDSPYRKDLFVLEGMMTQAENLPLPSRSFWKINFSQKRYLFTAAALVACVVVGLNTYLNPSHKELSYVNGQPIAQEDVNRHTQDAFTLLSNSINAGLEAQETVNKHLCESDKMITDVWSQTMDSMDEVGGYELTNY